ncbi:hypothetical protein ATN89_17345 [Comamonas thiooxydans]|uniref:hypothetical protein n=1 Tax=Comamonas thiooxydans TaxID=363952 RepID=UPI0007C4C619|nr:hypothetical protein [Comamonas thiooxydans]OAD82849.1 hypothetical protein ATN89_17345 [Comamonas thiooxydans]
MDSKDLSRCLEKIDIEQYFDREGIDYTQSYGTNGMQLNVETCPACGEGGRKVYVNAGTGLGNCFHGACGEKFNKFKLVRLISGLHGDALDNYLIDLAADAGWAPAKPVREIYKPADHLSMPSKCIPLPIEGQNLAYLQARGVTLDSLVHFELSYCHGGWYTYKTSDGGEKYVSFDQRVLIPIRDMAGTLVSYQGRDISGTREPKYLFPAGFAVAGSHLYNANTFIEGIHTHAVVGEGAFDAIAIRQALLGATGLNYMIALATFGMHLSAGEAGQVAKFDQMRRRGLKHVTFMWDGEGKALLKAIEASKLLIGIGLEVSIALLPADYDPAQGPGNVITPPSMVLDAIFRATPVSKKSMILLTLQAARMRN